MQILLRLQEQPRPGNTVEPGTQALDDLLGRSAALGERLNCSPEAARALVKRLRLPRQKANDGKVLVSVDLSEVNHKPMPARSPDDHHSVTASLKARMKDAASGLRFEEAARLRDQLFAIERSLERQTVASTEPVDQDVFHHHREADRFLVYVLYVRQGRLHGGQAFPFSGQQFPDAELLQSFVNLYYAQGNLVPDEVLLPRMAEEEGEALAELLSERRGKRVRVLVPRRGERAQTAARQELAS